jgi:hypothetical protein
MDEQIYDSATLLGVFWADDYMEPPENYWLKTYFGSTITFDTEEIDFTKITDIRKLAPLVVPTMQGTPIYSAAERLITVAPAYVKAKDTVSANRMVRRQAGLGELGRNRRQLTPAQRYQLLVADIVRQHRFAVERRWEWMASKAIIDGKITLKDDRFPERLVDFQRAASHTVTLGSGARWGDAGVSIVDFISAAKKKVRDAKFGGVVNRMTVGSDVWEVMRADAEIREFLNINYRLGANINLKLGPLDGLEVEFVGNIEGLQIYVYSDYYQEADGTVVPYMSPKDIVLTAPSVNGVMCYGAIQDKRAGLAALPIFMKMWDSEDPSGTMILTQSAPLAVPVNPNATYKATVVA